MKENPFSAEELNRAVCCRRLKHAVAQHLPPDAYGARTNLLVVLRNESAYGEMLGVAVKTQIAAGDTYDCPMEYHYVPATWWDHLLCALFPKAGDEKFSYRRGKFYIWMATKIKKKELPMYVERIHVCPHADIDFHANPNPHVRHLLEKRA